MSARIGIAPSLVSIGIKKSGHQPIIVGRMSLGIFGLKDARALELGEAFKFIARETPKEIVNSVPICRDRITKQGTDQGRARGDSCQN